MARSTEPVRARRDEHGATLVLALIFVTAVALVLVTLASTATTNLRSSESLVVQRNLEYGANAAGEITVLRIRYKYTTGSWNCFGPDANLPGGVTWSSYCVTRSASLWPSQVSRVVAIYVCAASSCAADSPQLALAAKVTFDDLSNLPPNQCSTTSTASCGEGLTINSWQLKTANH